MVDDSLPGADLDKVKGFVRNNKVPELRAHGTQVTKALFIAAWKRLTGQERVSFSRPSPSVYALWLKSLAFNALAFTIAMGLIIALDVLSIEMAVAFLKSRLFITALPLLGVFFAVCAVFPLGVAATHPPPKRPACQAETLEGKPHPFFPFHKETGLLAYVPDQVWLAQIPLVFHGIQMGTRMSIVRLGAVDDDGKSDLLVHSPIPIDDAMRKKVDALGTVRFIVAPNAIHHLWVGDWKRAYPDATCWAAPGLVDRRSDLDWAGTLDDDTPPPWGEGVVDHVVIRGHPFHQEVALFHRASQTLLLSDGLENLGHRPETSSMVANAMEAFGMAARPTPPTDMKLTWKDHAAGRASIDRILAWDFRRIVLAHGRLIEVDAKDTLADGWRWLDAPPV